MSVLLNNHIRQLHLRNDAPFPSEVRDAHELVRNWRFSQRLKLVRSDDPVCRGDSDDADSDPDLGGDAA